MLLRRLAVVVNMMDAVRVDTTSHRKLFTNQTPEKYHSFIPPNHQYPISVIVTLDSQFHNLRVSKTIAESSRSKKANSV
ncbi:MAG: hypothetical protein HKL80_07025 [Acidimicrobiales bacterium]|nr:hypothetical protein [Acidimicrobiales bacterium]